MTIYFCGMKELGGVKLPPFVKAEEIKKGYWFYDDVLRKPVQAREDGDKELAGDRRYTYLPVTRELLIHFGFTENMGWQKTRYEKDGFCVFYSKQHDAFMTEEFGELRRELKFMHEVQKKYREDVEIK